MLIPTEISLKEITTKKDFQVTTAWSRLEGRPWTNDIERALKAEVRDALWMLTKQWQLGEFEGEDAGSPVVCKLSTTTSEIEKYCADGHAVQPFPKDVPFETLV